MQNQLLHCLGRYTKLLRRNDGVLIHVLRQENLKHLWKIQFLFDKYYLPLCLKLYNFRSADLFPKCIATETDTYVLLKTFSSKMYLPFHNYEICVLKLFSLRYVMHHADPQQSSYIFYILLNRKQAVVPNTSSVRFAVLNMQYLISEGSL